MTNEEAIAAADRIVHGGPVDMGPICPNTGFYVSRCGHCGAEPLNASVAKPSAPPDTVYAHVERTVRALCDVIIKNAPTVDDKDAPGLAAEGIKILAEAVQALSAWHPTRPLGIALETPRSACPCGFGTGQRSFHAPGCPRIQENDE